MNNLKNRILLAGFILLASCAIGRNRALVLCEKESETIECLRRYVVKTKYYRNNRKDAYKKILIDSVAINNDCGVYVFKTKGPHNTLELLLKRRNKIIIFNPASDTTEMRKGVNEFLVKSNFNTTDIERINSTTNLVLALKTARRKDKYSPKD